MDRLLLILDLGEWGLDKIFSLAPNNQPNFIIEYLFVYCFQVCEMNDGTKSLKLGDFGLATEVKQPLFVVCGTPTYVAPDILSETG